MSTIRTYQGGVRERWSVQAKMLCSLLRLASSNAMQASVAYKGMRWFKKFASVTTKIQAPISAYSHAANADHNRIGFTVH